MTVYKDWAKEWVRSYSEAIKSPDDLFDIMERTQCDRVQLTPYTILGDFFVIQIRYNPKNKKWGEFRVTSTEDFYMREYDKGISIPCRLFELKTSYKIEFIMMDGDNHYNVIHTIY